MNPQPPPPPQVWGRVCPPMSTGQWHGKDNGGMFSNLFAQHKVTRTSNSPSPTLPPKTAQAPAASTVSPPPQSHSYVYTSGGGMMSDTGHSVMDGFAWATGRVVVREAVDSVLQWFYSDSESDTDVSTEELTPVVDRA